MGVNFDAGESMCVQAGGQLPIAAETQIWSARRPEEEKNAGTHEIYMGLDHLSSINLRFVPPWKEPSTAQSIDTLSIGVLRSLHSTAAETTRQRPIALLLARCLQLTHWSIALNI